MAITPSFSRALEATVEDHEGAVKLCKVNEARFQGARRVENLIDETAGFVTLDAVVDSNVDGIVQSTIQSGGFFRYQSSDGAYAGTRGPWYGVGSLEIRVISADPGTTVRINTNTFTGSLLDANTVDDWVRLSSGGQRTDHPEYEFVGVRVDSGQAVVQMRQPMLEDSSNQSNKNPSEYIDKFTEYGCGVDGVRYFPYENGNTVLPESIVSPMSGPEIAGVAYLNENAATNLLLQSTFIDPASATPWNGSSNFTSELAVSYFPNQQATKFLTKLTGSRSRTQSFTMAADTFYTVTLLMEVGYSTTTDQFKTGVYDSGGTLWGASGIWTYAYAANTFTIASATNADVSGSHRVITENGPNGERLIECTFTFKSTHFTGGLTRAVYLYALGTGDEVTDGNTFFHGAQAESGEAGTSFIVTEDAAVTRPADRLSYEDVAVNDEFVAACDYTPLYDGAPTGSNRLLGTSGADVNDECRTYSTSHTYSGYTGGGCYFGIVSAGYAKDTRMKYAFQAENDGDGAKAQTYLNGVGVMIDKADVNPIGPHTGNNIWQVGHWENDANSYPCLYHSFQLFRQPMVPSQLLWLSTIGNDFPVPDSGLPPPPPPPPPPDSWRTEFGGGSLPAGWTFVQNGTSNATLTNDDGAVLTIPAGTASDSISSTSTPDDSAGLVTDVSGDFDIAVRISTRYSGDDSTMFGFILRGATDAQMIRFQVYAGAAQSKKYGYERFDGAGAVFISGILSSTDYLLGNPHWLRATRSGTTYTFYGSTDGVTWHDESGPLVSSVDALTLKLSLGQYSEVLGDPVRIDEVTDLLAAGATDARKAVTVPVKGATQSTDLTTLPTWLTLSSQVDGGAVHSTGKISLSTSLADGSRGAASYVGIGYAQAGLLASCQLTAGSGSAYAVVALAADDGGPQIDVYSNSPSYLNEIRLLADPVSLAVSAHRPISNDSFNEPYTFIGSTLALPGTILHYRMEKFDSRFRIKHWADSNPEPSGWNVYDGEIDTLRGVGLLEPYFSVAHNPGSPANATFDLLDVEFYELT